MFESHHQLQSENPTPGTRPQGRVLFFCLARLPFWGDGSSADGRFSSIYLYRIAACARSGGTGNFSVLHEKRRLFCIKCKNVGNNGAKTERILCKTEKKAGKDLRA